MTLEIPAVDKETQYRAIGILRGKYFPSVESPCRGEIELGDGRRYLAGMSRKAIGYYHAKAVQIERDREYNLTVWVRSHKELGYRFTIVGFDSDLEEESSLFSIRGQLCFWNEAENTVAIRVIRNGAIPKQLRKEYLYKPFIVVLQGALEKPVKGQFWDLKATFAEEGLKISQATKIKDPLKKRSKLAAKKKKTKKIITSKKTLKVNLAAC